MPAAFKQQAHSLVESLPDSAGWAELAELIGTIIDAEAGLADSEAGRLTSSDDVRREFGLE